MPIEKAAFLAIFVMALSTIIAIFGNEALLRFRSRRGGTSGRNGAMGSAA